jgi:hypothetical protein
MNYSRSGIEDKIKNYLVEVTVQRMACSTRELNECIDPISEDLNKVIADFSAKTGKEIVAVRVRKIGNKYKIVLEISR